MYLEGRVFKVNQLFFLNRISEILWIKISRRVARIARAKTPKKMEKPRPVRSAIAVKIVEKRSQRLTVGGLR
jgi:hypothetical protein